MNELSWLGGPPRKILLATDLSARSDRALERAVWLARQWQAELFIVHVIERSHPNDADLADPLPSWRRGPDALSVAKANVVADLHDVAGKATIVIEEGDPAESIVRVAEQQGCQLIVIGVARNELLGQFNLGRTVDSLIRGSRIPLLIVKKRARAPYRHVVVATDFSESSRRALDAAAGFFPGQELIVFHAYDAPLSGRMVEPATHRQELRRIAERDSETFLEDYRSSSSGGPQMQVLIEQGAPSPLLQGYVADRAADLVVAGTDGRGALFEAVLGSVAKRILDEVPCDILLVRAPRAAAA